MVNKKIKLPLSIESFVGILFIINGIWLLLKLGGFNIPFDYEFLQKPSVWFAAFGSVYGGFHILLIKFRHRAVKSLL